MWNILPMPVVENFCGGVRVTFQRKSATENATENATTQKTTQKTTQIMLQLMKETPEISIEELATACGITRDGINYNIKKLKEAGHLRRIGGDNGGHWEVIE